MNLQQRSLASVFAALGVAHVVVLVPLFRSALSGGYSLSAVVVAVQAIVGVAALGVGVGFSWALDAAAAPVKAIEGLSARMAKQGSLSAPPRLWAARMRCCEPRSRVVGQITGAANDLCGKAFASPKVSELSAATLGW